MNFKKKDVYMDSFEHSYKVDLDSQIPGGQGVFLRTEERDLALKVALIPGTDEILEDITRNAHYLDLRILPIPDGMNITLPLATLKDATGYVMKLLDGMKVFRQAFAIDVNLYDKDKKISEKQEASDTAKTILFYYAGKYHKAKKLYAYAQTGGIRRRLMAYMKVAAMLAQLHTHGLVYGDFSDNNVFISEDLNYDNVWLIDADNLNYAEKISNGGYYTPGVAAPELVKNETGCSFYSDCFAFAVSFFEQLFSHHPFEGKAFKVAIDEEDYFRDEVEEKSNRGQFAWILDRDDQSNAGAQSLLLKPEFALTKELQELYQQTFSLAGRNHPESRPAMMQWAYEICWAHDNVIFSEKYGLDYVAAGDDFECCPHKDNLKVPSIRLSSYKLDAAGKRQYNIWQYTHELTESSVNVPLRIINGFSCQSMDETSAFQIKRQPQGVLIKTMLIDGAISFSEEISAAFCQAGSYLANHRHFFIRYEQLDGSMVEIEGIIRG